MNSISKSLQAVKIASDQVARIEPAARNNILQSLSQAIMADCNNILVANQKDLVAMDKASPLYDRLQLTEARIKAMALDVSKVAELPSPLKKVLLDRHLPNGLHLQKITVPLGVVGVIYESRPNVTIDVFSLCFKSGNACILKGGKEAHNTNLILYNIIRQVLRDHGIAPDIVYLMPPGREAVQDLLQATGIVDVCIPRGSSELINFVRHNAKIPVIETGAGVVHIYFDHQADLEKGRAIVTNAKTRRVGVCNALDCLVIHAERLNDLPNLLAPLAEHQVKIYADHASYQVLKGHYPDLLLSQAQEEHFGYEFLSYRMAIKTINNIDAAVTHIKQHTSGHSEAIISEDHEAIEYFLENIDAAAVYVNASTAFTDGGEFGMGAEIGISTQKLHARGPMGLEELTSYKWLIYGNGQIR